jgi:hypothetical protein
MTNIVTDLNTMKITQTIKTEDNCKHELKGVAEMT